MIHPVRDGREKYGEFSFLLAIHEGLDNGVYLLLQVKLEKVVAEKVFWGRVEG